MSKVSNLCQNKQNKPSRVYWGSCFILSGAVQRVHLLLVKWNVRVEERRRCELQYRAPAAGEEEMWATIQSSSSRRGGDVSYNTELQQPGQFLWWYTVCSSSGAELVVSSVDLYCPGPQYPHCSYICHRSHHSLLSPGAVKRTQTSVTNILTGSRVHSYALKAS